MVQADPILLGPGYLQRLDTSETRITARFQHGLSKMGFAAYSEEFCNLAGVRKVHGRCARCSTRLRIGIAC